MEKDLSTAVHYLCTLLDWIERVDSKEYYRSDMVAEIDDFIKEFENK